MVDGSFRMLTGITMPWRLVFGGRGEAEGWGEGVRSAEKWWCEECLLRIDG